MTNSNLGLQRGTVQLSDHDPAWAEAFVVEKERIETALGDKMLGIEHIGSTAIPGLKAKPILDLMVAVGTLDTWEEYQAPLRELGYEFRRDFRENQQHVLFVKGPEESRTHYLKLTELDSDFWKEHIVFRDYLVANPDCREEYQKLKESLLDEHKGNREPYTAGKAAFIADVLKKAGYKGEIV